MSALEDKQWTVQVVFADCFAEADFSRRRGIEIMDSHVTGFGRVGSFRP